jgi:ADP-ribose pyrophosphatase
LHVITRQPKAIIRSKVALYEGFLRLYRYQLDVQTHAGATQHLTREMMERGHAVAVLAHDPARDAVVLGNEFRPGALVAGEHPYRDQLIAGSIDEGESAIQAAVRETREEAGLTLCDPVLIHPGAFVSSGGTSEKIALVYGTVDSRQAGGVHGNPGEQEDILTVLLPAQEFIRRVRSGDLNDLKTLVAGYWFAEHHGVSPLPAGDQ